MPTKIKPDYRPGDRVFELMANRYGITKERAQEFIGHEMGEFLMYWEDTGKAKANWDSTCLNWMKRQYDDKKESMAMNRELGRAKDNVFQEVAGAMMADDLAPPPKQKQKYHHPEPQPSGETMTQSQALKALGKLSKKLGVKS